LIISIVATAIAFVIPKTYKATSSITLSSAGTEMGGLQGLISGNSFLSFGADMMGLGGSNEDLILGILNSRTLLTDVIYKFGLFEYYSISDSNMNLSLKAFRSDISIDLNEFALIEVNIYNKDPQVCADIVNYMVELADSINVDLNIENARRNRIYIEERYIKNQIDLKTSEEVFSAFQKEHGIFSVDEQLKLAVSAAGELAAEKMKNEIILNVLENQVSKNSFLYKSIQQEIAAIKKQLKGFGQDNREGSEDVILSFENLPELQLEYIRLFREVEIQNKILEFLYPVYEQAKMDENKSIPTLLVVDHAVPPDYKDSPKRAFIILTILFFAGLIHILIVFRGEAVYNKQSFKNPLEQKENKWYRRLTKLYKLSP